MNDSMDGQGKAEQRARFIQLRARGFSLRKIAGMLKMSPTTLCEWNKELEREIASAKALELEAIQEEFFLLKSGRIRLLGQQLKRLLKELNQRDYSEVPTGKLLELLLKVYAELKSEQVELPGAAGNRGVTKLDSSKIAEELERLLERYRAGDVDQEQVRGETDILLGMLRAYEQQEIEGKLERLAAVLEGRPNGRGQ